MVPGGNEVRTQRGQRAVVFDPPPEAEALARWRARSFLEVEHQFAKAWRQNLSEIDLDSVFQEGRDLIKRFGRPKDLSEVKSLANEILRKPGARHVANTLTSMVPNEVGRAVVDRWRSHGSPPIRKFAPYAAHVMLVDLFFCIGLGADLIGRERPSNRIDLAYLYYLPFCMVFTSRDRLHERTAPLFINDNQFFIHGDELKTDLSKLDAHYSATLSDEVKLRGVMSFAHYPPIDGNFLVSELWDKLMSPDWRDWASRPHEERSKERDAKIIEEINAIADAPRSGMPPRVPLEDVGAVLVRRQIPLNRGKWRMLPPEVEQSAKQSRREDAGKDD